MTDVNAQLAVGVHPLDNSVIPGSYNNEYPVPPEHAQPKSQTREQPFSGTNYDALPVFERASKEWTARTVIVSKSLPLCTRKKGRKQVVLFCPASATAGVSLFPSRDEADANGVDTGYPLAVGASVTLYTEGPVYANELTAGTPGTVVVMEFFNPVVDD